jgi:hypothetical protein
MYAMLNETCGSGLRLMRESLWSYRHEGAFLDETNFGLLVCKYINISDLSLIFSVKHIPSLTQNQMIGEGTKFNNCTYSSGGPRLSNAKIVTIFPFLQHGQTFILATFTAFGTGVSPNFICKSVSFDRFHDWASPST